MKLKAGIALLLVLLTTGAIATAVAIANTNEKLKQPEELTQEELKQLYKEYNITENDIKFAKGELPHYLVGTPLDDKVATMGVVVIEEGKAIVKNWTDPKFYQWCLRKGYKVVNATEWFELEKEAREKYIKKYGVDPANPKVEVVNGVPLPVEYVKKLAERGILRPSSGDVSLASNLTGPWTKNDELYLWIFEAKIP